MRSIDYYRLLKEGPETISGSDWEEVLKTATLQKETETYPEAAAEALQNLLFDGSKEWLDKKFRILEGAEKASTNPGRRSEYCLNSLKHLCVEAAREATLKDESPELSLILRQVSDHLRQLSAEEKLLSHRLRSKKGRDLCNLWGLPDWGLGWLRREPAAAMEHVTDELPTILSSQPGKGVFDYSATLPGYLPTILMLYSAALSTAQMSSTVVAKISPPLMRTSVSSERDESTEQKVESHFPGCVRIPGPEQLLRYKQLREGFLGRLTDREKRVFELKEAGFAVDEIADKLDCSGRTVNNDWKSIFSKCRQVLAASAAN